MADEVSEDFIEIHDVATGKLNTLLELLSPVNKINTRGRQQYLEKRADVLATHTNFIEVDLLRNGEPMPVISAHNCTHLICARRFLPSLSRSYAAKQSRR
jgi:hypothetical protein